MILLFLCIAAFSVIAAEPVLEAALNEGSSERITLYGTAFDGVTAKVLNQQKTEWRDGRIEGKALFLKNNAVRDKKDGCVIIKKNGKLDLTKPFTVSCWIFPEKGIKRTQQYTIIGDVTGDRGPGLRLFISYGSIRMLSGDGKKTFGIATVSSRNPIELGAWSHVGMTWDGSRARIYVNGELAAESSENKLMKIFSGSSTITIGSYREGYAYGFNGAISGLKIFDSALSQLEMLKMAKEIVL